MSGSDGMANVLWLQAQFRGGGADLNPIGQWQLPHNSFAVSQSETQCSGQLL